MSTLTLDKSLDIQTLNSDYISSKMDTLIMTHSRSLFNSDSTISFLYPNGQIP